MAQNWNKDKRWSDRFLPGITRILGEYFIGEPPIEEDQERGTDLIVLGMNNQRFACRVRRHSYLERYANEFTVRVTRPSGVKTELAKILEGWGDFMFYAFATKDEMDFALWSILSLNVFRLNFHYRTVDLAKGQVPGLLASNHDASSDFRVFRLADFPGIVLASGGPLPVPATKSLVVKSQAEAGRTGSVAALDVGAGDSVFMPMVQTSIFGETA